MVLVTVLTRKICWYRTMLASPDFWSFGLKIGAPVTPAKGNVRTNFGFWFRSDGTDRQRGLLGRPHNKASRLHSVVSFVLTIKLWKWLVNLLGVRWTCRTSSRWVGLCWTLVVIWEWFWTSLVSDTASTSPAGLCPISIASPRSYFTSAASAASAQNTPSPASPSPLRSPASLLTVSNWDS